MRYIEKNLHVGKKKVFENQRLVARKTYGLSRRQQRFKSAWGRQQEIKPLREIVRAFSLWGRFAPQSAPQIFKILFSLQAGTERNGCSSQEWVFQPQMDTY